ncbi:hypothetical protein I4F81_008701 [Pyropia yezoensis]|uniref:Uncharacterized protein n=1 Tax=Pyropia yezoensis TaxID=2788 RepID=A0ACC3C8W1_PYRYE|nr:hypothetical protein I4F81_008701 [Neopyropia yezoensis]
MSAEAVETAPSTALDWGHSRGASLKGLVAERVPFSDAELDEVLASLCEAAGAADVSGASDADDDSGVDWAGLRAVLASVAHQPHKEWAVTAAAASEARAFATVAAAEFRRLYAGPGGRIASAANGTTPPLPVDAYAAHKDGIFARYRTLAEVLGVALVTEAAATAGGLNVLVETSGRDVAMFSYFDAVFPEGAYRKLALHFTVNTLDAAAASVTARMTGEMEVGAAASASGGGIHAIIAANAGGPYGPEQLPGVQADAERVWAEVSAGAREGTGVAAGWWTATVAVDAKAGPAGWAAQAASPDGDRVGAAHVFVR